MKSIHFDSAGGASGDMILASLLDLGISPAELKDRLASLNIGDFEIESKEVHTGGLRGKTVKVIFRTTDDMHRGLRHIRESIEASALPDAVRASSIAAFTKLAEVEAGIHNTSVNDVHFHEVGALDSIVDIVGACLAVEILGVTRITCSPLPLGYGTTASAHGTIPVPAPATLALLRNHPVIVTDEPFELVTPTAAALMSTWTSRPQPQEETGTCPIAVGYGFGDRKLNSRPNLLRAILMQDPVLPGDHHDMCLVIECNIDDSSPELLGSLTHQLLAAGALDVFTVPIQMKKQRPGSMLSVLCKPRQQPAMLDLIFRETTTFGVRQHMTRRTVLERRHEQVSTPYGPVRMKVGRWRGQDITRSPEHEDCVKLAKEKGVSVRAVYEAAIAASPSK